MTKTSKKEIKEAMAYLRLVKDEQKDSLSLKLIRNRPNNRDELVKGKKCVLCGEGRAVDLCHIIPVSLSTYLKGYEFLGKEENNLIVLCKNHHYCLDKMLLNDHELEIIYQAKKEFIESIIYQLVNSNIKLNPLAKNIRPYDIRILKEFDGWLKWSARIFFIQNP